MGEQRAKKISEEEALKEAEAALKAIKEKKALSMTKATESKEKVGLEKKDTKIKADKKPVAQKTKIAQPKIRSQKYQEKFKLVDRNKSYPIDEAIELVKKTSYGKFSSAFEIHLKFLSEKSQPISLRGLIKLPHPTGKKVTAAIIDEKMMEKIKEEKKTKFDILIATPQIMPKLGRIAKILGPQGKMPSPKSGTISSDPQIILKEIKEGRMEYKTDPKGIIHMVIGKINDDNQKIKENFQALLANLPVTKLQSIVVCATMGPGIKVEI